MKAIVTGGGTGGHLFPAMAIIREMGRSEMPYDVTYVGGKRGMESDFMRDQEEIETAFINVQGLDRRNAFRALKALSILPVALLQSLAIIWSKKPQVIYGTGGYVTLPVALAGRLLGVPVVLHEFNACPGLTTRLLQHLASEVLVSFSHTRKYLEDEAVRQIGTPVRAQITQEYAHPDKYFSLKESKPTVLVLGGSHGSRMLLEKILSEFQQSPEDPPFQLILQTGKGCDSKLLEELSEAVGRQHCIVDFIDRMGAAYQVADFVISRAGASTVAELIATKTPAIIVPWSGSAGNHQLENASVLAKTGAVICLRKKEFLDYPLFDNLAQIMSTAVYQEMCQSYQQLAGQGGSRQVISNLNTIALKGAR
ncbi:MAG: undecaprenyldiphospho-muramoylpentapeptide beta-N-acetylglucosaminyltransferase [Candidatus Bipolaricaulota bacterium]